MRLTIILSVILMLGACGDESVVDEPPTTPDTNLIVPGQSAAGISLGDDYLLLIGKQLTPPVESEFDSELRIWKDKWNDGLTLYVDEQYKIYRIILRATHTAKTAGGNGIGSTRDEVKAEFTAHTFNSGQSATDGRGTITEYWEEAGIEFEYWIDNWTVSQIMILPKVVYPK